MLFVMLLKTKAAVPGLGAGLGAGFAMGNQMVGAFGGQQGGGGGGGPGSDGPMSELRQGKRRRREILLRLRRQDGDRPGPVRQMRSTTFAKVQNSAQNAVRHRKKQNAATANSNSPPVQNSAPNAERKPKRLVRTTCGSGWLN